MTPKEYKKAAEKHLSFCNDWIKKNESSKDVTPDYELLEIYYLSGYIAECLTIYTIYAYGGWNPTGFVHHKPKRIRNFSIDCDIEEYFDPVFTHFTGFDFYKQSTPHMDKNQSRIVCRQIKSFSTNGFYKNELNASIYKTTFSCDSHYLWKRIDKEHVHMGMCLDKCVDGSEINKISLKARYYVAGHRFQEAIYNVILGKLDSLGELNSINFFRFLKKGKTEQGDIWYTLLHNWKPSIRYYSSLKQLDVQEMLTKYNLIKLIKELDNFYYEISKI